MKRFKWLFTVLILMLIIGACSNSSDDKAKNDETNGTAEEAESIYPITPNLDDLDPDDPKTEAILYGEEVFNETNVVMPDHVGNELSCLSCHADVGLLVSSSPMGVPGGYRQYCPRESVRSSL